MFAALAPWEARVVLAALVAAVLGGLVLPRLVAPRLARSPRFGALAARAGAWRARGARHAATIEVLAVGGVLAAHVPVLAAAWRRLAPWRSPMGPDADGNYLSALALETRDLSLYAGDRYPAFAALVAWLSPDATALHETGVVLGNVAAVGCGLAAWSLARAVGGRVAGVVALALVLRLSGLVDAGRQFTPYALLALADLAGVVGLLAIARARHGAVVSISALVVATAAAFAFAADPKQAPTAILFVVVGCVLAALRGRRGLLALAPLLLALPLANGAVGCAALPVLPVSEITSRVDLGLTVAPGARDPWRLGDALTGLPAALLDSARVSAPADRAWLAPLARAGLPMELPSTSPAWLILAGVALVVGLPRRASGDARAMDAITSHLALPLALLPIAPIAWYTLHLHFQHRYFLALAVLVVPLVVAGGARVVGAPALLVAGLLALFDPTSPWSRLAPTVLTRPPAGAEPWVGVEPPDWAGTANSAGKALPADAVVYDFAQERPWTMLAARFPYRRCALAPDVCVADMARSDATPVAILFPGEAISTSLPEASTLPKAVTPRRLGRCWQRRMERPNQGAAYEWTCEAPPTVRSGPAAPANPGAAR